MEYLSIIDMAKRTGISINNLVEYFYHYDIFFRDYRMENGVKKHPPSKAKIISTIHTLKKNKNWIVEKNILKALMDRYPDDFYQGREPHENPHTAAAHDNAGDKASADAGALMQDPAGQTGEDEIYDHYFNQAPIGIFQADLKGRLQLANSELAWLFGYESSEQLIEHMQNLNEDMFADKEISEDFFFQLFEAEEVHKYRAQIATKDGRTEWVLAYASVIKNEKGRFTGYYGFLIDIAELKNAEDKLLGLNEQLKRISQIDSLCDIPNRRCFDEYLAKEWKRMARNKQELSIILCDIDFFKIYNDTYGHQAGDECLRQVAKAIDSVARRAGDMSARYGGEEFVVVLPETNIEDAFMISENIRLKVAGLKIDHENSKVKEYVTLSLGVANMVPDWEQQDQGPQVLIEMADQSLYRAKEEGRNRSVYTE